VHKYAIWKAKHVASYKKKTKSNNTKQNTKTST